jgi:hypothetical protein
MPLTEEELKRELQKNYSIIGKSHPVKEEELVVRKRIITTGFSLKRAVIYSGILNRKYS